MSTNKPFLQNLTDEIHLMSKEEIDSVKTFNSYLKISKTLKQVILWLVKNLRLSSFVHTLSTLFIDWILFKELLLRFILVSVMTLILKTLETASSK